MKKMNMYEAPVAEMIEIEAIGSMMSITSQGQVDPGNPTTGLSI